MLCLIEMCLHLNPLRLCTASEHMLGTHRSSGPSTSKGVCVCESPLQVAQIRYLNIEGLNKAFKATPLLNHIYIHYTLCIFYIYICYLFLKIQGFYSRFPSQQVVLAVRVLPCIKCWTSLPVCKMNPKEF